MGSPLFDLLRVEERGPLGHSGHGKGCIEHTARAAHVRGEGGHGAPATVYYDTAATDKGEGGVGNADTDNVESTG